MFNGSLVTSFRSASPTAWCLHKPQAATAHRPGVINEADPISAPPPPQLASHGVCGPVTNLWAARAASGPLMAGSPLCRAMHVARVRSVVLLWLCVCMATARLA